MGSKRAALAYLLGALFLMVIVAVGWTVLGVVLALSAGGWLYTAYTWLGNVIVWLFVWSLIMRALDAGRK